MSVPAAVKTQLDSLNLNVNKLLVDRDRLTAWFDDGLGASVWSLLSASNQTAAKNALTTDMQAAVNALQSVVNALAAM